MRPPVTAVVVGVPTTRVVEVGYARTAFRASLREVAGGGIEACPAPADLLRHLAPRVTVDSPEGKGARRASPADAAEQRPSNAPVPKVRDRSEPP
jgi:hypothetical protein